METPLAHPAPPPAPAPFPPQAPLASPFPALSALADLGSRPRWVAYRAVWRPARTGGGKWTKVPLDPHADPAAGRRAATDRPATWGTLAAATAWAQRAGATGVGYVLRALPPAADDDRVCGVDLDAGRDPATGALAPWAAALVARLDGYTEASPSGTGVHVLVEGRLPPGWRRRPLPGVPGAAVELYDAGRFLTVTGRHVPGTPATLEPREAVLAALHAELAADAEAARAASEPMPGAGGAPAAPAGAAEEDVVLLERARAAANGAAFDRLWRGETGDHGGDASAADLALCAHLRFWTGGDSARMDRLFRRSGLMRPKWDERRGDRTYGARTLARALAGGGDVYAGPATAPAHEGTLVARGATKVPALPDKEDFSHFSRTAGGSGAGAGTPTDAELADAIGEVPALPAAGRLAPALAEEGPVARAVWLEPYVAAARALSPRTPNALHEAAGVFALATAVARRAYVRVGGRRLYPAFYLAFVERSTLYSKTGGLDVLRLLLDAAGLRHLLLPASFTPRRWSPTWPCTCPRPPDERARWLERHRHAAQRAVVRDELAGLFEDCTREYNTGLLPLLLKLDGAPAAVDPDLTLSRGLVEVRDVGINLIGATTPAAFRQHAAKPYHWANGLFGRFALLAAGEPPAYAFWSEHVSSLPAPVVDGLKAVYGAFPQPRAAFVFADPDAGRRDRPARPGTGDRRDREGRGDTGDGPPIVGAVQEAYEAVAFALEPETWRAWRAYDEAVYGLVRAGRTPERLDPTYGRLPTAAIRLALTLAAAEWALDGGPASGLAPLVERRHWAAAQEIAERWRHHAHHVLARALREEAADDAATAAARLVRFLAKAGGPVGRSDLQRGLHLSAAELDAVLAAAGPRVRAGETPTAGKPARWVALADLSAEDAADEPAAGATKATKAPYQMPPPPPLVAPGATKGGGGPDDGHSGDPGASPVPRKHRNGVAAVPGPRQPGYGEAGR